MEANYQDLKLVFFSSRKDDHFKKISAAVYEFFSKHQVFLCRNINELSTADRYMLLGFGITLIIVRNENELNEIFQLSESLKDHSVILILDDSINDLTHKALKLYPRYTGYIKDDYTDIFLVLEKMTNKIQNKILGG